MAEFNNNQSKADGIINRTAISPYRQYCDGFSSPGATGLGYVTGLKVETGTAPNTGDPVLDGIVAYDAAEINGTYIGQINMLTASSFSGLAGQVWGYDLAVSDELEDITPLFTVKQFDGTDLPVYDAAPLLDASKALFGTVDEPRFPLVPGAHTICANKNGSAYRPPEGQELKEGEAYGIWSIISLSIARDRTARADLFVEDAGLWTENTNEEDLVAFLEQRRHTVAETNAKCGEHSITPFAASFIGYAYTIMEPDHMGMGIVVGPYFTLAKNAIPAGGFAALQTMKLSEWIKETSDDWIIDKTAVSPYEKYCDGFSSPGATGLGYVTTLKVETGVSEYRGRVGYEDRDLNRFKTVAYHAAEINGTCLDQINIITASSFSGLAGQIWGYDLAANDELPDITPLFTVEQFDGTDMPVYDAAPLLDASKALFGTLDEPRYPLVPGAHTICADKGTAAYRPPEGQELKEGEAYGVWSIISLSIARDRTAKADLFVEDAGLWTTNTNEEDLVAFLEQRRHTVAETTVRCGQHSETAFDASFIGYAYTFMEPNEIGAAIVVGPYVTLAQNAIPAGGFDALKTMKLSEWIEENPVG